MSRTLPAIVVPGHCLSYAFIAPAAGSYTEWRTTNCLTGTQKGQDSDLGRSIMEGVDWDLVGVNTELGRGSIKKNSM